MDLELNDRAAIDGVLAGMPRFTEPVTLEDMSAFLKILKQRLHAQGLTPMCEVYRHTTSGPVRIRVGRLERETLPAA